MKERSKVCVVVQSRLSSQRIPGKMLKPFAGTTLFDIACQKLDEIEYGHVSVYEPELIDTAKKYGIHIYQRSEASAKSENDTRRMYEWYEPLWEDFDYVVMFNACLPFLTVDTIRDFINTYCESNSESMFGVFPVKDYFWDDQHRLQTAWPESQQMLNTKTVGTTYQAAHALYGSPMSAIAQGRIMGDFRKREVDLYDKLEQAECLDIDYDWQFDMCEALYEKQIRKG